MSPRRIKEASVAGESPDKSEQRKSSGTTEERDPRFAVFREPVAAAGAGSTTGRTTGTVTDTATAVFRSPHSADTADEPEEVSEDASTDPSEGGSVDAGSDTGTDRADGAAASGGDPEGPEVPTEGAEAPQEGSRARGEAGGPAGADEATRSEPGATAAPGVPSAAGSGSRPDTETASGGTAGSGDASGSGADAESDAGSDAGPAPVTSPEPQPDDEPDDELERDGRAGTGTRSEDAAQARDGAQAEPADDDENDEDDGPDPQAFDADEPTDAKATGEREADEPADAKAADSKPAEASSSDTPRVPRTRTETPVPEAAPEAAAKAPGTPHEDAKPAGDEWGVDQPTTAFKAPRKKQVDQPTTALKLPPPAPDPEPAPEAPAERTSKFVPLRSDDARPGEAGRSVPPVGPTVTPDITAEPDTPRTSATPAAGLVEAERTRQQPMPPKPPLDLLAELTNTPPPPQTPVRTVFRRIKIWTPLVLLLVVVFAIAQAVRPLPEPTLALSAAPTYTFDGEKLDMPWPAEGQGAVEVEGVGTIGTYGTEKSAPIASVAKIMTAYVILKGHPITGKQDGEQIVVDETAGEEANRPDESTAPIKEGQKYTERQMLQLLMIPSGNNVARLLARWDATTVDAFVEKMNAAAEELGMTKSVYTDPSGLESSTRSTPADQLKLAKAVTQYDVFREIVNMPQADIPGIGKTIYNNNVILLEPGVNGIKTGSSTPAGGNLVWTADTVIDGKARRIIGAVMGANLDGTLDAKLQRAIQNSLKLIKAAQKGVESATVVKKGQVVGYVDNGLGTRTPVVATKDLKAVGWAGLQVELDLGDLGEPLQHAAEAGTVVGEVTVGTGTGKVSAPVALRNGMTEPAFGDKLTRIT
ncbi:D-alanyl-D-alanine carboxypeptidase [Streptomyces sp. NPDC057418]|uniref:D-alanyl-D-alanine carboxypeptidase n=1 Tax=Streptomyces sp. NPDC057418 TaxID=3346126 RepID=UPI0036B9A6E3